MDRSAYQMSDLEDIEFHWKDPEVNIDAVFCPSKTPSPPSNFNDFEVGWSADNPFLFEDEKDEENLPPAPPTSERPNQHSALLRSRPIGNRTENDPDSVFRSPFNQY